MSQLTLQDRAKVDFLSVCNMKRLSALVGEGKEASFLSDFIMLADQSGETNFTQLAKCCIEIASMRLPISRQAGQAYAVKRGGALNVEIGYKGWLVLARRAGIMVKTHAVFNGDDFNYEVTGFNPSFYFKPNNENLSADKDTGFVEKNLKFIIVITKDLVSQIEDVSVLDINLLKRLRDKGTSKNSFAYKDWLLEMYKAKAIKYVLKKMPIDTNDTSIFRAFAVDDKNDIGYKEAEASTNENKLEALKSFSSASVNASENDCAPTNALPIGAEQIAEIDLENL